MSSSHSEPGNAAPAALVRPEPAEQGPGASRDGGQNKPPRRWPHASSANPPSLLTQALAATQQAERRATTQTTCPSPEASTNLLPPFPHSANEQTDNGLSQAKRRDNSTDKMAMLVPERTDDGRRTLMFEATPSSAQFSHHDRYDVRTLPMSHRELINSTRGRGTSLERTEKEKRVQSSPKGSYSTNPGDTALASSPAPPPRSPLPSDPISNTQPTDGVRADYRLWRDPRANMAAEKAWSIGKQGDGDSEGGRVEKSITEAMAGIEPNNRSRKASHSLGFFKEGLPEDKSKKREPRNRGRSKEGPSLAKGPGVLEESKQKSVRDVHTRDSVKDAQSLEFAADEGDTLSPLEGDRPFNKPPSEPRGLDAASNTALGPAAEGYFDHSGTIGTDSKQQIKAMPPQLLAEIRRHHNLAAGAAKGTSFSRSLPVTESERPKGDDGQQAKSSATGLLEEESLDYGAELSLVKSTDDEDESGEEQISCALFVPHQTSHDAPEEQTNLFESVTSPSVNNQRHLDVSNPQQWLEEHEVPSRDLVKKYLSQEAKPRQTLSPVKRLSLRVEKEKEIFISEREDVSGVDQQIPEARGYITAGEESSLTDDDLTPTGSVKPGHQIPSGYHPHIHDQQQHPKQPLEAIELIPYRHQVGGHTTMWRFSKRAVCKQLNNRENEFYEKIERYHPELLKFLPRCV
jgi:inositol-hexakisphosphate kinase